MNEKFAPKITETEKEKIKQELKKILAGGEKENKMPDAVFILSGGIKETVEPENKYDFLNQRRFRSNSYLDEDPHGAITGAEARVVAAAELGKFFPEMVFVATSHGRQDEPAHAAVQKAELIRLGIEGKRIFSEEKSVNTITEFVEMIKMAFENNWQDLAVITSGYHVKRCQMLWDKLDGLIANSNAGDDYKNEFQRNLAKFQEKGGNIRFVGAEDVLMAVNNDYRVLIEEAYQSEGYKKRVGLEEKGIKDLEEGKYRFYMKV
ncbi:MAG: YdcF family protein [Patescibacteria group bacterium]|nr:YdcF family protein [Patescibacteria group bacterium]